MTSLFRRSRLLPLLLLLGVETVAAQTPPKHELRGAWIATVINLDWPSSAFSSPSVQRQELATMLLRLHEAGTNAVFFQVRSECDAMYDSPIEPWSRYLTGQQGLAPQPTWDPLDFAVETAHGLGMELHAWINPYRAVREPGAYALAPEHPAVAHPEWILTIESDTEPGRLHQILNPGLQEVRDYVVDVVEDIVRRYDVDGVHFDDYFYPYPPFEIGTEDLATWQADDRGLSLGDWRRDNVNRLVASVQDAIAAVKPYVKFGISPFGIWKSGVPEGTSGLSAYDVQFADAVAWAENGWVDYLAPQLYWGFGGGQDFAKLSSWWASVSNGRHIYPGLAAYRQEPATSSSPPPYGPSVVPHEIRYCRTVDGIEGHVLFRAKNLTVYSSQGLADTLETDLHRYTALTPPMNYRDLFPPGPVSNLEAFEAVAVKRADAGYVQLTWDTGFDLPRRFAVYRVHGPEPTDPLAVTADARNLVGVTFEPIFVDSPEVSAEPYHYVVTALNANSAESAPSDVASIVVHGSTGVDRAVPVVAGLDVWPNPFGDRMNVRVRLDRPTRLRVTVFDVLGREVSRLADSEVRPPGTADLVWDAADGRVPAGVYLVVIETDAGRVTRAVHRVR